MSKLKENVFSFIPLVAFCVGYFGTVKLLNWAFVPWWLSLFEDYVTAVDVELYIEKNTWYLFPALIVGHILGFISYSKHVDPYSKQPNETN